MFFSRSKGLKNEDRILPYPALSHSDIKLSNTDFYIDIWSPNFDNIGYLNEKKNDFSYFVVI